MRYHILGTILVALALAQPGPAKAAVSLGVAQDNIDSEFNYWPDRGHRAQEFQTAAGHKYRVYKPQVSATAGGGLLVIYSMDHDIANGRDDHAEVSLTFDAYGVLSAVQVSIKLANASNTFQSTAAIADLVGNGAAGSALAGAGQVGAAVALVAKGLAGISKAIGEQVNQNGGSELLPYEVQFVSEHIAKAVHAAGRGAKVRHEGDPIQFWTGNSCGEGQAGTLNGGARNVKLPANGIGNDDARSVRIYNNIVSGTTILVFDDGSGSRTKDDWAEITVINPARFAGVSECVTTFQRNRSDAAIRVVYHKQKGNGNLDGKVSHVTVTPPR